MLGSAAIRSAQVSSEPAATGGASTHPAMASVPDRLFGAPGVSIRNETRMGAACVVVAGPWIWAPQTDPSIPVQSRRKQTRSAAGVTVIRAVPVASGSPHTDGGAQVVPITSWSPLIESVTWSALGGSAEAVATLSIRRRVAVAAAVMIEVRLLSIQDPPCMIGSDRVAAVHTREVALIAAATIDARCVPPAARPPSPHSC